MVTFKVVVDYISFSTVYFGLLRAMCAFACVKAQKSLKMERHLHFRNGSWFLNGKTSPRTDLKVPGRKEEKVFFRLFEGGTTTPTHTPPQQPTARRTRYQKCKNMQRPLINPFKMSLFLMVTRKWHFQGFCGLYLRLERDTTS